MMKKRELRTFNIRQDFILIGILLLALVSCVRAELTTEETSKIVTSSSELVNEVVISVTSPAINTPSPLATPSTSPTAMATLKPTQTATLMPTRTTAPTQTSTSTALPPPPLTPLPTFQPDQRGQRYDELMTTNNGCQLPCWWGLKMGESSMDELLQIYTQFDPSIIIEEDPTGLTFVTIKFVDPEIDKGLQTRHMFTILNGILLEAEIEVMEHGNFTPLSLMEQFGQPSEVWLWTIPEPYQDILPAYPNFYFPEQGVMSAYAEPARNVGENVEICFNADGGSILLLWNPDIWNPDGSKGFVERANASSELRLLEDHRPIGEVSNWDTEQLYTILMDPSHSECLETPSNLWSPP